MYARVHLYYIYPPCQTSIIAAILEKKHAISLHIGKKAVYLHHKTKQSMIFSDNPFNQNAYGGKQKRICQMLLPVV